MTEQRFCRHAITVVLIILCIWGGFAAGWGLPAKLHPDEYFFIDITLAMFADGVPAPRWYGAPASVLIHLAAVVVWLQWVIDLLVGQGRALDAFVAALYDDPAPLVRALRFANHVIFLAAGLLLARLGEKLDRPLTGLLAMIGLLGMPMLLNYAVIWRMEPLSLLAVMMCLLACAKMFETPTDGPYRLAGAAVGFGVAVKFPLVFLAVPVVISHLLAPHGKGGKRGRRRFSWLIAAGVYSLVAAFLLAPFVFIHFPLTFANVITEARETHIGATGKGFIGNLGGYLWIMRDCLGWPGLVLMLLGLGRGVQQRNRLLAVCWGFALVFLLFISALNLWWPRWLVPVLPVLALTAAMGAAWLGMRVAGLFRRPQLAGLVTALLMLIWLAPLAPRISQLTHELTGDWHQDIAQDWVLANLPAGTTLLMDRNTPPLPASRYSLYEAAPEGAPPTLIAGEGMRFGKIFTTRPAGWAGNVANLKAAGITHVMIAQDPVWRQAGYEGEAAFLDDLALHGELIYKTTGKAGGLPVQIWQIGG